MLWELNFYKTPDSPHSEQFTVGYFISLDEVEAVKTYYMSNVPGFRDTPCGSWEITGHAVAIPDSGASGKPTAGTGRPIATNAICS